MDPFTAVFLLISAGVAVASAAIGSAAQHEATKSQLTANARNKKELERSAQLEDANAVDALARGSLLAGRQRMEGTKTAMQQQAAYSDMGWDPTVGTPAQVGAATAAISELDALTIQNNAAREAWGHKEVARKYRLGEQVSDEESANLRTRQTYQDVGTGLQIGGSLLNTAGGFANAWKPTAPRSPK